MMRLRTWMTVAMLSTACLAARADDFGKILGKVAEDALRKKADPQNIERMLTPRSDGEIAAVNTSDGWTLVAHHYPPQGRPRAGAMPVVLCHGLTYNAKFWDLDPSVSFARYLARNGFDVWAVDLRGCGMSRKWVFKLDEAPEALIGGALRRATKGKFAPTGYQSLDTKYAQWTLDHHIAYDIPAFVRLVQKRTGAKEVAWVGHSMGGIVAIGHLARFGNPGIGRLVTVGSQVTMENGQLVLPLVEQMILTRTNQLTGDITGVQIAEQTRTSVHNLFFNVRNVDPKVYEALGSWATDIPAVGLMKQYATLANKGVLLDAAGKYDYARSVGNITVPMLIACGANDAFAPPPVQKYLYDHVGSEDKTLVVFGRGQGFAVDAGHDDALVGLTSGREAFPLIARWLLGEKVGRVAVR